MPHSSQPVLRKSVQSQPTLKIESGIFSQKATDASHTLFAPMHYEPGYAYPLLVWLHGQEADERQLRLIMPLVSLRNYVAVAPRGIVSRAGEDVSATVAWPQEDESSADGEQRIFDAIEAAVSQYHISKRKIFLVGFGCGGTMAFRVGMNNPSYFAGVLSLCGALPSVRPLFSNLTDARRLPLFLATGRDSQVYGADKVSDDLRLLHTAGMSITLRQYPCGQELAPQMLGDVDRWVIEQITAAAAQAER